MHCYIDSAAKPQIELESRSGEKRPAMHVSQPDPMIKFFILFFLFLFMFHAEYSYKDNLNRSILNKIYELG